MRKTLLLLSALLLGNCMAWGQDKMLTMEDAMLGYYKFRPSTINQLSWRPDSKEYTFIKENKLYVQSITSKNNKPLISLDQINTALKSNEIDELKRFPRTSWISFNQFSFYAKDYRVVFDIASKSVVAKKRYKSEWNNITFNKDLNMIAYTKDNNLYVSDRSDKDIAITSEDDKNIVSGQAVSRSEFGISGGIFWSPKSKYIAFYQKDESEVTDYPLVNIEARVAELRNIKYPMAGMDSEHVKLGIYNVTSNKTVFIDNNPDSEQYLTNISWEPNEQHIYIAVLNREQNHMKLNKYNASTGKLIKTLFEEKSESWVEPEDKLYFISGKADRFVWHSERDGYKHLYLYNTDGKFIKQLTKGDWAIRNLIGTDKSAKYIYFTATKDSPIDNNLYKVSMKSGKITRLTKAEGYHNVSLNGNKSYFIDNYSSLKNPRTIEISSTKGKKIKSLLQATDPYKDYNLGEIKLGNLKAKDGKTDLYYRMILPSDFDPNKKYPVIVYVYGGPHSQLVTNRWMGATRMWQQYMAQKGYIAFTLDNRGTAHRGHKFESAIHRQLGTPEVEDQMVGVDYLMSLPYVDKDRVGVHGWSYGGFMTISMLLKHNDIFKVGVAGGPVIDWKYYEIMYGERYMDKPQENPEGYKNSSLINKVDDLKGRLMIIHGSIDPTVVWQHSQLFLRECVKKGKLIDYMIYPTHPHNVRGKDRVHLMNTVSRYFEDHL